MNFEKFKTMDLQDKLLFCFEKLNLVFEASGEDWTTVKQILHEIQYFQYLDEWCYKFVEILPDVILEETDYLKNQAEWKYLDYSTFQELRSLYQTSTVMQQINQMLEEIHDMINIEIYSDSQKASKQSYEPFMKFLNLVEQEL